MDNRKVEVPRTVKIGAYDYRIIYVRNLAEEYKLLGQSLADKQLIKIDPSATYQTKSVTLWHEIIHSISDTFSCEFNEKDTDRLAQGIAALLSDSFDIEFDWSDIKEGEK